MYIIPKNYIQNMDVKVLNFTIFLIHKLANAWKVSPGRVYGMLNSSGILDNYIVKCYDVLHSLGEKKVHSQWTQSYRKFIRNE